LSSIINEGFFFFFFSYCSIVGNVTTCDYSGCNEITTKHYIKGEDPEFYEMYEKSHWFKHKDRPWYKDRVLIIGFCDNHSLEDTENSLKVDNKMEEAQ